MAKKTNFTEKNPEELTKLLAQKREELRQMRFAAAGARAKNPNAFGATRKDVARILTELGARNRAA